MLTMYNREFLDAPALSYNNLKTEDGFKNESLALVEYTNGEEFDIGLFFVTGSYKHNVDAYEMIFTLIGNPQIWAAKDSNCKDLEAVDRSDFDTDMRLVVAPSVRILNHRDLASVLMMLNRNDLASKECLSFTDISEIIDFAKSNRELFGFSTTEARR